MLVNLWLYKRSLEKITRQNDANSGILYVYFLATADLIHYMLYVINIPSSYGLCVSIDHNPVNLSYSNYD